MARFVTLLAALPLITTTPCWLILLPSRPHNHPFLLLYSINLITRSNSYLPHERTNEHLSPGTETKPLGDAHNSTTWRVIWLLLIFCRHIRLTNVTILMVTKICPLHQLKQLTYQTDKFIIRIWCQLNHGRIIAAPSDHAE